ncbi:MAG: glycoside hydrolase family 73 protein [Bacteroidota bacterium]
MPKPTRAQFKAQIAAAAKRVCAPSGFPWQLPAAQACLESDYGQSVPTDINNGKYSYNIFGIKGVGPHGAVLAWTSEYYPEAIANKLIAEDKARATGIRKGHLVKVKIAGYFRAYLSFDESLQGYMQLMRAKRYKPVWEHRDDPVAAAKAVQACGYATDPAYAAKVVALMRAEGWLDR